jgi:hypothetical protein
VLVFLGVLITTYQQLIGATDDETLSEFKRAAAVTLAVFAVSLVSVALDVGWLATDGGKDFYRLTVVVFFVQLAAIAGVGGWTTLRVLLKG